MAGLSQSDAYRQAYDCSNMTDASVHCLASRLRNDVKIASWLDAIAIQSASTALEDHLAELRRLKAISIRSGNLGAAVQCEQLIGKACGHYVEQFAVTETIDHVRTLREIAKRAPELARVLAQENNVPLEKIGLIEHERLN